MNYIYIGDIVGTHGIKGEVKVVSEFECKRQAFKNGVKVYAGKRKEELIIRSHRKNKIYDLLTFEEMNNINDVIALKGDCLYIERSNIKIKNYLKQDLIGLDVFGNDLKIGTVESIMKSKAHDILIVNDNFKKHLIPLIKEYIKNVDLENKKIEINVVEGLLNEN